MTTLLAAKGALTLEGTETRIQPTGFAPRAVLMWWTCQEGDGAASENRGGIGFAAVDGQSGAIAWISRDGAEVASSASWAGDEALAGLTDSDGAEPALRARVELTDGAVVLHPSVNQQPWRVHYLALGGIAVHAETGWLAAPSGPGEQRLELGFDADLILLVSAAVQARGVVSRGMSVGFGAASGLRMQAAAAFGSPDGAPPGAVGGAQGCHAAVLGLTDRSRIDTLARLRRFDSEGITIDWQQSPHPRQLLYLALGGTRCRVGAARSPAKPARVRTWRLGPRPQAIICFSWGLGPAADARDICRLSLGASASSTATGSTSWDERDTPGPTTATHVHSSTEHLLLVSNTQTGELHASARLIGLDRLGFTLGWDHSDGRERQFLYVLLGEGPRAVVRTVRRLLRRRGG